jgi:hypothetical protein
MPVSRAELRLPPGIVPAPDRREAALDDLNFLRREALKCRHAARRSADRVLRDDMEKLARAYDREAALHLRRSIAH